MTIRCWQVGGAVRDRLRGQESKDIDYAVQAPSYDAMVQWVLAQGGTIFMDGKGRPVGADHFTARGKLPGGQAVDFVLCRKDGAYSDGRHPDTVEVGTLYDDLARRDFTVNAIAYDEQTGEYIDPSMGGRTSNKICSCASGTPVSDSARTPFAFSGPFASTSPRGST